MRAAASPSPTRRTGSTATRSSSTAGASRSSSQLPGAWNLANAALALVAAATHFGIDPTAAAQAMRDVESVAGRFMRVPLGDGRHVTVILSKNPAGWSEALRLVADRPGAGVVIAVNARVADGKDPSWLWDVPYELLAGHPVAAAGERRLDVAVRLRYADLVPTVDEDPLDAARAARRGRALRDRLVHAVLRALPQARHPGTSGRMTSRESAVRVGLVYPELLGTYGDRGNAVVLVQRCRWRGIPAELVEVRAGAPIPDSLDVYLFGGGEDDPQLMAAEGMRASRANIERAHAGGAVILAVCAGFQLLGHRYDAADGEVIEGAGIVDLVTRAGHRSPHRRGRRGADDVVGLGPRRRPGDAHRLREPRRSHDARRGPRPARDGARRRRQRCPHRRRSVRGRRPAVGAPRRHVHARPGAPAQPAARRPPARLDHDAVG